VARLPNGVPAFRGHARAIRQRLDNSGNEGDRSIAGPGKPRFPREPFLIRLAPLGDCAFHRLPRWWTDDASASSRASLPAFGPPPSAHASAYRFAAERAEASWTPPGALPSGEPPARTLSPHLRPADRLINVGSRSASGIFGEASRPPILIGPPRFRSPALIRRAAWEVKGKGAFPHTW
jgi:hypothetical protein